MSNNNLGSNKSGVLSNPVALIVISCCAWCFITNIISYTNGCWGDSSEEQSSKCKDVFTGVGIANSVFSCLVCLYVIFKLFKVI